MAALATWDPSWGGKKIQIYCVNTSICQILCHRNLKSPTVAALLHTLYCLLVKFGCLVSAVHLLGADNTWADCLSEGWLEKFYAICPQAAPLPTNIGSFQSDFRDLRARCPHRDLSASVAHQFEDDSPHDGLVHRPAVDTGGYSAGTTRLETEVQMNSAGSALDLAGSDQVQQGQATSVQETDHGSPIVPAPTPSP